MNQLKEEEEEAQIDGSERYTLVLYVAGQTPKSLAAFSNLKKICESYLQGRYSIEVIDLLKHPELAREHANSSSAHPCSPFARTHEKVDRGSLEHGKDPCCDGDSRS